MVMTMIACLVEGQAEEAAAYEEAHEACFKLGVESYRHPIPRISNKTGELKWSMMEMWPMTVSSFQFAFVCVPESLSVCLCLCPCEPFSLPLSMSL